MKHGINKYKFILTILFCLAIVGCGGGYGSVVYVHTDANINSRLLQANGAGRKKDVLQSVVVVIHPKIAGFRVEIGVNASDFTITHMYSDSGESKVNVVPGVYYVEPKEKGVIELSGFTQECLKNIIEQGNQEKWEILLEDADQQLQKLRAERAKEDDKKVTARGQAS